MKTIIVKGVLLIMWQIKTFKQLTTQDLFQIYQLRGQVFNVEQKRIYNDVDEHDLNALHVMYHIDGQLVCYARIFQQDEETVTFGRVVIAPKFRGKGLGNDLLDQIMTTIKEYFPENQIEIEAQAQVEGYYRKAAFESVGRPFIHASTPHIKMVHSPLG